MPMHPPGVPKGKPLQVLTGSDIAKIGRKPRMQSGLAASYFEYQRPVTVRDAHSDVWESVKPKDL